tara:strand:- start:441 stop:566 length:126 start_codon:yes stop_codon:yes gene_type:complete
MIATFAVAAWSFIGTIMEKSTGTEATMLGLLPTEDVAMVAT